MDSYYNKNSQNTLKLNPKKHTYTEPGSDEEIPYDFELTAEQEKNLTDLATALLQACSELRVPVQIAIQTANNADGGDVVHLGRTPGPRACQVMHTLEGILRVGWKV